MARRKYWCIGMLMCFLMVACQHVPEENKNTRKSMLGLGFYPEVSKEALDMLKFASADELWNDVERVSKQRGVHFGLMEELKKRVRIQLLEEGIRTVGISARAQGYDSSSIVIYPRYSNKVSRRFQLKSVIDPYEYLGLTSPPASLMFEKSDDR